MIEDLGLYVGKCIVVVDNKVVVSGDDVCEVMRIAKEKYADKVMTLMSVPKYDFHLRCFCNGWC